MRGTLLVPILLSAISVLAQPKVDVYQIFRLGDSGEYLGLDATGVEPGPAGNGVIWDFSNLNRKAEDDYTIRFIDPADAPSPAKFPGTDLVTHRVQGDEVNYDYLQVRGDRIFILGSEVSQVGEFVFNDVSFVSGLRLNYEQSTKGPIGGGYTVTPNAGPGGTSTLDGQAIATYDGFGTLILPDGRRIPDVIRIKFIREWDEESLLGGQQVQTRQEETRYHFYEPGHSVHLFELIHTDQRVTPSGGTPIVQILDKAAYRISSESNPQLTAKRGTHLTTPGGIFNSQIIVHNQGETSGMLQLQPLNATGMPLNAVDLDVAPSATSRQDAPMTLGNDAGSFYASGCADCTFSVGYRANIESGSTAQVHQTQDFRREFVFYPGEWDLLFDGQAIINVGDGNAAITASQIDFQGNVLETAMLETALVPGGKHLSLVNDQFTDRPDSLIRLESNERMGTMVLRISSDFRFLYQNNPLPSFADNDAGRWLAHLTSDAGGFSTEILVHNRGETQGSLNFQPFDAAGQPLAPAMVTVEAGQTRRFAKAELFPSAASHASISGSTTCLASVGYRAQAPGASTAVIHETAPVGTSFRIYPGEWQFLFDGVALINAGEGSATISLSQIGDTGQTLTKVELVADLVPNAKFLGLLEGRVSQNQDTVLLIESDQPLAILSLRLSKDNLYLYNNEALP